MSSAYRDNDDDDDDDDDDDHDDDYGDEVPCLAALATMPFQTPRSMVAVITDDSFSTFKYAARLPIIIMYFLSPLASSPPPPPLPSFPL